MSSNTSNLTLTTELPDLNATEFPTHHHYQSAHGSAIILFLFGSFAMGVLARRTLATLNLRLPYTVVLLILGVLFGLLSGRFPQVHAYAMIVETDPHLILSIFLPVLIFESAFSMEVHTFIKAFVQVVLLAIPGLALASFLTCVMARFCFTYGWDWNEGMMFGSILSATDPVAVVALLRDVGASKQLAMVIEGESLLNDGAAIVFFNVFLKLATSENAISGGDIVVYFIRVAIGGPFVGFLMAKLTLFFLSHIFNDALSEITITLASTYITYYVVEEFCGMSGVLAVVVLGVTMSSDSTMVSPEIKKFLHMFWETLAYLANTLIFIIVGIVISEKAIFEIHGIDWFYMFSLYIGSFFIRGFVIAILSPLLRHTGYGLTAKEGLVMTWGGLRGAVGLALALQVAHHDKIDQEHIGLRVLIHVSGVVLLTLVVNATSIFYLLRALGMSDLSAAKRMAMANSLRYLQEMRTKTLNMLKTDRFLADADWEEVEKQTEIHDPYKCTEEEKALARAMTEMNDSLAIKQNTCCPECDATLPPQYNQRELNDMKDEAVMRMLKAQKLSYWRQFEQGMLSREATRKLQECTEVAADTKGKTMDVQEIMKCWEMPAVLLQLKKTAKALLEKTHVVLKEGSMLQPLFKFTRRKAFYITVYIFIALDIINIVLSICSMYMAHFFYHKNIFRSLNLLFVSIYIIELVLKLIVQRKYYFRNVWHILCIVIVVIGMVDVIQNFALPNMYGETHDTSNTVAVVFILLRSIRILRFLEPAMPYVLNFIKTRMSMHLSYGFDVGRGYVAGEEEIRKLIDHMSDHKDIAQSLKHLSDKSRLDVIRNLGMLSKRHPDIALSIKTRQAVRTVLNNLRDGVHSLTMDGILEEQESIKLEKIVEEKMKRLLSAPPTLPLIPPEKLLRNVPWLRDYPDVIEFIRTRAVLKNFEFEESIIREGDPPGGVYIMISGMVRLESTHPRGHHQVVIKKKTSDNQFVHEQVYVLDYMTSGNIIGEMALMTNRQRSANVVCETAVQVMYISQPDMKEAMQTFCDGEEPLEYRLWHVCANRIAANIFMQIPAYRGWTKDKIKLRLENSYIAEIDNNIFIVEEDMSDIVLVHGLARNPNDGELYEGPCYVPWKVPKLDIMIDRETMMEPGPAPLGRESKTIILVVPSEEGSHSHDSKKQGGHGAFINSLNQLCLKHASQRRLTVESKWKKVQMARNLGTLFSSTALNKVNSEDGAPNASSTADGSKSETDSHQQPSTSSPRRTNFAADDDMVLDHASCKSLSSTSNVADDHVQTIGIPKEPEVEPKLGRVAALRKTIFHSFSQQGASDKEEPTSPHDNDETLPDNMEYFEGGDVVMREPSVHTSIQK